MSFVLAFHPEAAAELECVTGDYEARVRGLGSRFREEIERACRTIVQQPLLWRLRPAGYHRVNLPGFPYYVAYVIHGGSVFVIAIGHASRRPDYFKNRVP